MQAIVFRRFGDPDVLEPADLPEPDPGPGEVAVRVAASTVNPTDLMMRRGEQAAMMTHLAPPFIAGMEFSGRVAGAGEGVDLAVGTPVIGVVNPRTPRGGAHAEVVVVPAASVAPLGPAVDLVAAATVPMNALTALLALDIVALAPGGSVLVTGGTGMLGGSVVQLARRAGLVVLADARETDVPLLRALGADLVLPRCPGMAAALREAFPAGVDALIDGALLGRDAAALVRDGGAAVSLRRSHPIDDPRLRTGYVSVLDGMADAAKLRLIAALIDAGGLVPRVAERFSFRDARAAHRLAEAGPRGRVVLTFAA